MMTIVEEAQAGIADIAAGRFRLVATRADLAEMEKAVMDRVRAEIDLYESRAVRAEDWSQIRDSMVKEGWQFRNLLKPKIGDSDVDNVFWSSDGEPDIRLGVIYVRRLAK
jgi:hypothetical protein